MSEYQQIPQAIRSFLATRDRAVADGLPDLAARFAALSRDASDRLVRCEEYVRRGMRSEAVHLADCQPRLLEVLRALRSVDLPEWQRTCVEYGLEVPPALPPPDAERDVERACARERSLEPLLAAHRVLAVGKANVRERLAAARALAAQDPDNECWAEQVEMLEAARLVELRTAAGRALRGKDLAATAQVLAELTDSPWRRAAPDDLTRAVGEAIAAAQREESTGKLRAILPQFEAAREAGDYERGRELREEWLAAAGPGTDVPDDLRAQVEPLEEWLATEQRRRNVARKVQAAQPAIQAGIRNLRRRARLRVAAVVLVCAAVLGGGGWAFRHFYVLAPSMGTGTGR